MIEPALLYGILDLQYVAVSDAVEMARQLMRGGAGVVQLRAKTATEDDIVTLSLEIAPICREAGVAFILNDYPHLVPEVGASGVHVGQDDVPVARARAEAGAGAIVGKSTHSIAQALAARDEGADYIGFGPIFATPTKPDYVPIGFADLAAVHAAVDLPIFCIGGIKLGNLAQVLAAGGRRACVVSEILKADDPAACAAACLDLLAGR